VASSGVVSIVASKAGARYSALVGSPEIAPKLTIAVFTVQRSNPFAARATAMVFDHCFNFG
jgi:hypothetical protein